MSVLENLKTENELLKKQAEDLRAVNSRQDRELQELREAVASVQKRTAPVELVQRRHPLSGLLTEISEWARCQLQYTVTILAFVALACGGVYYALTREADFFLYVDPLWRIAVGFLALFAISEIGLAHFRTGEEIKKGNVAVGLVLLAFGLIVAASVFPR